MSVFIANFKNGVTHHFVTDKNIQSAYICSKGCTKTSLRTYQEVQKHPPKQMIEVVPVQEMTR